MSIGFIGSSSNKRTVDVFSGSAGRQIDVSLQNVLGKYDQIKVDLDRLTDRARLGTYDITSLQNYNAYNKDAGNGWAENWYAEYRAVLSLRADALQKKLQAAYNRVLERSAYAEVKSNKESIFAPYANRTLSGADVTYKQPISEVLLRDISTTPLTPPSEIPAPTSAPPKTIREMVEDPTTGVRPGVNNPQATDQREATIKAVEDYVASSPKTETPDEIKELTENAIGAANNMLGVQTSGGPTPVAGQPTIPSTAADNMTGYGSGIGTVSNGNNVNPPPPTKTDAVEIYQDTVTGKWIKGTFTENASTGYYPNDTRYLSGPPPAGTPLYANPADTAPIDVAIAYDPNSDGSGGKKGFVLPPAYYIAGWATPSRDNTTGYLMPKQGIKYEYMDGPDGPSGSPSPFPPGAASAGTWQAQNGVYTTVRKNLEMTQGVVNTVTTPAPATPNNPTPSNGQYTQYDGAYDTSVPGDVRKIVPEFAVGDLIKDLDPNIRDVLMNDPSSLGKLQSGLADISSYLERSFTGRQYDDIIGGNQYEAKPIAYSAMIYPMINATAIDTYLSPIETGLNNTTGGSFFEVGSGTGLGTGFHGPAGGGAGFDLHFGHLSAISGVGGFPVVPNIGLAGAHFTIPIPIPFVGTLNLSVVINVSYDIMSDLMKQFFNAIKKPIVETLQSQAYAASSGTAFDSYASRGEYHATDAGFQESLNALNISALGVPIPIGKFVEQVMDTVSSGARDINGVDGQDSLLGYKHAVQGAESRETETGAFFATNAFLSQFEMSSMESEYWIGTQQNEEVANMDLARAMSTAGREFLMIAIDALFAGASAAIGSGGVARAALLAGLKAYAESKAGDTMNELLYGDHNEKGKILNGFGSASTYKAEGYNYLEPDHKPFEGDSDFNYKPETFLSSVPLVGDFMDLGNTIMPDVILEGYSATRRYRKKTNSSAAAESMSMADWMQAYSDPYSENGVGARAHAGNEHLTKDSDQGIWADTALGDINEVYVGTRKIVFKDLSSGFGEFSSATDEVGTSTLVNNATITDTNQNVTITGVGTNATRTVSSSALRYTGADTREYGRRYDGANPISFETFNTGMYAAASGQGSVSHYDRRNQYNLAFTTKASKQEISLFGSQALNPTIGGFIKMQEIDKNKYDTALLNYENVDMNTMLEKTTGTANRVANMGTKDNDNQYFGAAADETLNELNQVLYEHMHLRADGRNLSLIKEYRDVFETGLMKNVFITGQAYHPSGGGITSSLEIRYDTTSGRQEVQSGTKSGVDVTTREYYDLGSTEYDPYNTPFLNKSSGKASIYLNNYFAYKKRASNNKT